MEKLVFGGVLLLAVFVFLSGCTSSFVCDTVLCDDANPCTMDSCAQNQCQHSSAYDGTNCPDGNCQNGKCVKIQQSNSRFDDLNFFIVKVIHKNVGFNPNIDFLSFNESDVANYFEHLSKTLKWLTGNENNSIKYKFLEYRVDYDYVPGQFSEYLPINESDYAKILQESSIEKPDVVVLYFESVTNNAIDVETNEEILGKDTPVIKIQVLPKATDEETLKSNLKYSSILLLHEIAHKPRFGGFLDAQYTWCGWSNPTNPSEFLPYLNCYFHSIYGAGGTDYEFPPFLVNVGGAKYRTVERTSNNEYLISISNTCKNNEILKIPDGKVVEPPNREYLASYVFTLTDRQSCDNEFQDLDGQVGVKIYRILEATKPNFTSEGQPNFTAYEIPFRYEKTQNNEYTVSNPITFSKKYAGTIPNFGSWHDIRESYSDENFEISVINEETTPAGEILSTQLKFVIKNDELKNYR
ncbi:MAG: hypothetical protein NTZ73_00010 [Candidatus Diapherotrites archaeon]|nr:hypothetical protein [Candidatus Diapherotrites archaeon]